MHMSRMQSHSTFHKLVEGIREIESINAHYALKNDLIEHLWCKKGETND